MKCFRAVCKNQNAIFYNASTKEYYCQSCARRINEQAPRLCDLQERTYNEWVAQLTDEEHLLCFGVTRENRHLN